VLLFNCSSETQNYLVYDNPNIWPTVEANDREELAALRTSLALGYLLHRAVVLPRFHCSLNGGGLGGPPPGSTSSSSSRWSASASSRYRRRPVHRSPASAPSTAGPPGEPRHECPLNGILNVTAFDGQFNDRYRENSFLRHPLVPELTRTDWSLPLSVHSMLRLERGDENYDDAGKFNSSLLLSSSLVTSSPSASTHSIDGKRGEPLPSSPVTLSDEDALRLLGGVGNRVLSLQSLYRINLVFGDVAAQKDFDARARKAFQRGTYRQL